MRVMTEKEMLIELIKLNVLQNKLVAEQINNNGLKVSQNVIDMINQICFLGDRLTEELMEQHNVNINEIIEIVK
jgi:hypothetical protein